MNAPETKQYLYLLEPSRPELATDPTAWTEGELQIARDHFQHLQRAAAAGQLILAGRCQDNVGPALAIFEADSDEAARRFMESDPFISSGLMRGKLHPYKVAVHRARF